MLKGFKEATVEAYRKLRLIIRVGALDKSGKTHFALTAPGPLGVLDMDRGLEGVIDKFIPHKKIFTKSFLDMPNKTRDDYDERWKHFEGGFYELIEHKDIRSIIVDTDTESWEIARLAFLGKLTQIKSHHYAQVNAAYRKLVDAAFDSDKNVIFIARHKKQYVKKRGDSDDTVWNGTYEAAGFTELPYLVQANLRSTLEVDDGEITSHIEFINCRQNMALKGEVLDGDLATFPWVASYIVEGTTPEDWE